MTSLQMCSVLTEMQKTEYMVFAGRQYFLGDKCQVALLPLGTASQDPSSNLITPDQTSWPSSHQAGAAGEGWWGRSYSVGLQTGPTPPERKGLLTAAVALLPCERAPVW